MNSTPIILSTWSFGLRGNTSAWPALQDGGSSLDAVEEVCRVIDADPEIDSVGFGGLPDREGNVTLDGCIMLRPAQCGSVCAISRYLHPVSLARRVMENTQHVMLAGRGADQFAESQGFQSQKLLSEEAMKKWEKWRVNPKVIDQSRDGDYLPPRPVDVDEGGKLFHDTVGVLALDTQGVLAGACSTSGMPYKLPGRVGDSPIIGSGLYVHPEHGAATATGTGELVMGECSSFLAVELMRGGAMPLEALEEALKRIEKSFELRKEHQVAMIALKPDGSWASAALRSGYKTSITMVDRSEVIEPQSVILDGVI